MMRRTAIATTALTALAVALLTTPVFGGVDSGIGFMTEATTSTHPSVGSWVLGTNLDGLTTRLGVARISPDGTAQMSGEAFGLGAWTATGPSSAEIVFVEPHYSSVGLVTIRADIEISADRQAFTGSYVVRLPSPRGAADPDQDLMVARLSGERIGSVMPSEIDEGPSCSPTTRIC